ncbi:desi2 [Symbiodinium natans]|uniref:Desi2 protein n=1 Tax=Symbiodinium natans TaxID=878477 RepID=A0A812SJ02_9DINO|nr:desi2 [Symbiodinium natans]
MQLVPRCYRCLDESGLVTMPQDIDRLECVCCFDARSGVRCIIIGIPGLLGERCVVGRVEQNQAESFAVVYDAKGLRRQVQVSCLAVDDCIFSGRTSRGDPCPFKGERVSLGLGLACLGCACVGKQAMDELLHCFSHTVAAEVARAAEGPSIW